MLQHIANLATSRWVRITLVGFWILSFLWMLNRGWVWESWEALPGGGVEHRRNYLDIHRTSLFVWVTMILLGYLAHAFKKRFPGYYGLTQVLVALIGSFIALNKLPLTDAASWLALAGAGFVIVRGSNDITEVLVKQKQETHE